MRDFLWGILTMASVIAGLAFLNYWRVAHDRIFLFFAVAFAFLAMNWAALALVDPATAIEARHSIYFFRLIAFVLIILGIIDKNRRQDSV